MYAITTKYRGATNTKGSVIAAKWDDHRLSLPYNHRLNTFENHKAAARAIVEKFYQGGFAYLENGVFVAGNLPDGSTVWAFLPNAYRPDDVLTIGAAEA